MSTAVARLETVIGVALAPIGLAALAFAVRSLDPAHVLPEDGASLHLPAVDWLLAHGAAIAGGWGDGAAKGFLAWFPPALASGTVVACFGITRHYFDLRVAVLAGALLCILPAHVWFSEVGTTDHHYVVAFVTTLLLGAGAALLGQEQPTARPTSACIGRAGFLGVAMASSLGVWPGTLPLVVVVQLAYGVRVGSAPDRESAIGWARTVAVAHAVAAIVLAPWILAGVSGLQTVWLAICGLAFAGMAELWRRGVGAETASDRGLGVLGFAFVACALMLIAGVAAGAPVGWDWPSPDVGAGDGATRPGRVDVLFTRFAFVAPLGLAWVVWSHRDALTPSFWFLAGWGLFLGVAALVAGRFTSSAAVAYVLLLAAALDAAFRLAVWRETWGWAARLAAGAVYLLVVGWALWPSIAADAGGLGERSQRASSDAVRQSVAVERLAERAR